MKRLICMLLTQAMIFSLVGCGGTAQEEPEESTNIVDEEPAETPEEDSGADEAALAAADAAAAAEEAMQEEVPAVDWSKVNPLTGEPTEPDISRKRPVMVMLNNLKQALPQSGNSQADVIYEILEEGGITRMLAVYQDFDSVEGNLGSIRSTRPYYVSLVAGLDGILVHAGGSNAAYKQIGWRGVDHIDALGGNGSNLFWRDKSRLNAGVAVEHTMFVTASDIANFIAAGNIRANHEDDFSTHLTFVEDATPADGSIADIVTIPYSYYKTGEFVYDPELGKYLVSEFGAAYTDGQTGEQVSVENVLIIMTNVKPIEGDKKGRIEVTMNGSGIGYFCNGGKYIPINWSREKSYSQYVFTTMDGQPLELGIGNSYVNIVPTTCSVSFVANKTTD